MLIFNKVALLAVWILSIKSNRGVIPRFYHLMNENILISRVLKSHNISKTF